MPPLSPPSLTLVAYLACFIAPVWSQNALPAETRISADYALGSDHSDSLRGRRNAPETAPSSSLVRSEYLAENVFQKTKSPTGGVPVGVEVSIKEWVVPTSGSHPHDPLATPDGSIWYTGQMANLLGRLNPRTGEFKEYRLKTPQSGPYGLVADCLTSAPVGQIGRIEERRIFGSS
jgi:streptogramin lyase